MRKIVLFMSIILLLDLIAGCAYRHTNVEKGTKWNSENPKIFLTFVDQDKAEGTISIDEEFWEIECFFGPGERDFAIYRYGDQNGDNHLFYGEYMYKEKEDTIVFVVWGGELVGIVENFKIVMEKI